MNKMFRGLLIIFSLIISPNILSNPIPSGSALSIVASVTITVPGNYTLSNDIVGTISIAADDVDLNLNNKTINGSGANCIEVTGQQNITIHNGKVENANLNGISLDTVVNVNVYGVDFVANATGIFVSNSNCVVLKDSTLRNQSTQAVWLGGGSENVVVAYNKILNNLQGIVFDGAIKSVVANNLINQSTMTGIQLSSGTNNQNTIEYNKIIQSGTDGILGNTGNFNTYAHNIIVDSGAFGINFSGSINNLTIIGNEIFDSGTDGMQLASGVNNCVVEKNICNTNSVMGIRANSSSTLYKGNICNNNSTHGIALDAAGSNNNTFTENVLDNNTLNGISIAAAGDDNVTKFNWAEHNGTIGINVVGARNTPLTFSNHAAHNFGGNYPPGFNFVVVTGGVPVVGTNLDA